MTRRRPASPAPGHEVMSWRSRSPLKFMLLLLALFVPFYLIGATGHEVLPGIPLSGFGFVCPALAASILLYRESSTAGVMGLLKRSFDLGRIRAKVWYAPVVLLAPGVTLLAYWQMRATGSPLPAPQFSLMGSAALLVAFFVGALGEELGWSGYVIDPMQERWGALNAGVLLGLVWAASHIVPLVQAHRSPAWIAWWSLYTVAARVILTWLFNNTGRSVFAAALYHAVSNLSWQLFPIHGSHWDPRVIAPLFAAAGSVVAVVWGPRTLEGYGAPKSRGPALPR